MNSGHLLQQHGQAGDIALLGKQTYDWQDIIYRPAFGKRQQRFS
jgi:hypothetical protein